MATLTIDNLPEEVMQRLRDEAERRSTTVSTVAGESIVAAFGVEPQSKSNAVQTAELLRRADAARVRGHADWLTPDFIRAAREDGRS